MSGETVITVVGNLTADPELRFTNSGVALASFTIASTPRTFDKQKNEWVDGEALFLRCTVWREYAENVANSLTKGMRVIARGSLSQRSFEKDGQKRTSYELDVDEIGPSLKYATAQVTRTGNGKDASSQFNAGSQPSGGNGWGASQNAPQGDFGGGAAPGGFGGGFDDEQPF